MRVASRGSLAAVLAALSLSAAAPAQPVEDICGGSEIDSIPLDLDGSGRQEVEIERRPDGRLIARWRDKQTDRALVARADSIVVRAESEDAVRGLVEGALPSARLLPPGGGRGARGMTAESRGWRVGIDKLTPGFYQVSLTRPIDDPPEKRSFRKASADLLSLLETVRSEGAEAVVSAEPDFLLAEALEPNEPRWGDYRGYFWALDHVHAPLAWGTTTGDGEVLVAVVDSGVLALHDDLKDNLFSNGREALDGQDTDGNGLVDDVAGWDFSEAAAGYPGDPIPNDSRGHGTQCAGILGARGNNDEGVVGLAWELSMLPIRFLDSWGCGSISNAVRAIDYAVEMGAKIISASWGGYGHSDALRASIARASDREVLLVAAAGNAWENRDVIPYYPASYDLPNVLSVTGVGPPAPGFADSTPRNAFGATCIHLAAPSIDLHTTLNSGGYGFGQGTSMATPLVAGAAALLLSVDDSLTVEELRQRLLLAVDASQPSLQGQSCTSGVLDLRRLFDSPTQPAPCSDRTSCEHSP